MSVYFDHLVQFPGSSTTLANLRHHLMSWHSNYSILAVASKNEENGRDGSVNFFLDEGEAIEEASIYRSVVVECMTWHPDSKIIAVGWQSGEITTYNHREEKVHEQSSIHRSPITTLQWNQTGSRLLSGDKSGLLVVWKVDPIGKLHPLPLHQHRLHSHITHCVMLHPSVMGKRNSTDSFRNKGGGSRKGGVGGSGSGTDWQSKSTTLLAQNISDPIICFCITQDGVLYLLTNSGDCFERSRVDGNVHTLILSHGAQTLSVVTDEMLITQFKVSYDGQTVITTNGAKLSGRNKVESIICVARKILASCANENFIRFWDFENSENFVLDIHNYSRFEVEESVTCIAYNPRNLVLAGGTNSGSVFLWKWHDEMRRSKSLTSEFGRDKAKHWEFLSFASLQEPTISLAWGSKSNLLSVNSGRNVLILSEHSMSSHFNQQVSVVQLSPGEVLVECHDVNLHLAIKTDIHISGIYTTKDNVILWSGKKLEAYSIARDKAAIWQAGSFPTTATIVTAYETSVYTLEKKQISIRTFQGTVKQVLTCMDTEGCPLTLSIDAHFLVCGTDAGRVKVWDISRREAKHYGATNLKKAFPELGTILSVHCSSNGSKISIIALQGEEQTPCLFLWFVDADLIKQFTVSAITTPTNQEGEEEEEEVESDVDDY